MDIGLLIEVKDGNTGTPLCSMEVDRHEGADEMKQETRLDWHELDPDIQETVRKALRQAWGG